jgi:hypothetical protein
LVGLLWMSDQPDVQTSTKQHATFTREDRQTDRQTDNHAPGAIRTHNQKKRAAAVLRCLL